MDIQHENEQAQGRFFIDKAGETMAELVYTQPQQGQMVIEHTHVDQELRGHNVGYALVEHAAQHARDNGMKITATCVFAKAIFERKPEFSDVVG